MATLPTASEKQDSRRTLIAGLMLAMLFGSLDNTIMGTAIPKIVGEFGGIDRMTWLTTAYMLSSTSIVLITGKLADLMNRKVIYTVGIGIFMLGSILSGMATSMNQLIWSRGLQGIGSGIMMPMAMIIIGSIFTGAQRAKWQGVFGSVFGLSSIIGPQLGGWIVDSLNWRWVFYINLPVGILAIILINRGLRSVHHTQKIRLDIGGITTMVLGVTSLLLALSMGGKDYTWDSWQILSLFGIAIVSLTSFLFIENRVPEPILPIHLLKNKTFALLSGLGFLMSIGMFGAIAFVPLFMQGIIGMSASNSGTVMTPMMLSLIVASTIGGRIVKKTGIKPLMGLGMILIGGAFYLLSTMDMHTTQLWAMSYMSMLGLGIGLVMPLTTLALQEVFPKSELGVVTSSSQFFRQIGGTFGITILGAVMNYQSTQILKEKLVPLLDKFSSHAHTMIQKLESMILHDPQSLYSTLLNPEALQKIPVQIQQTLVPHLKESLVFALNSVYLYGLIFIGTGFLLTLFLKNIRPGLKEQNRKEEENGVEEPIVSSASI